MIKSCFYNEDEAIIDATNREEFRPEAEKEDIVGFWL